MGKFGRRGGAVAVLEPCLQIMVAVAVVLVDFAQLLQQQVAVVL